MSDKVNGFIISLSDGTKIDAIPNKKGMFSLDIGDSSILIKDGEVIIEGDASNYAFTSEIVKVEPTNILSPSDDSMTVKSVSETKGNTGILKRCITCGPRYYCITNGCANTPCGWICD
ncbi:MAG: hypothetical protein HQL69_23750 [Magnetococcales bacterium]|nr:hypothetical protein [Magnetococcales bacterium]